MIGALVGIYPVPDETTQFSLSAAVIIERLLLLRENKHAEEISCEWGETCVVIDHSRCCNNNNNEKDEQVLLCSLVLSRDEDVSRIETIIHELLLLSLSCTNEQEYEVELWATTPAPLPLQLLSGPSKKDQQQQLSSMQHRHNNHDCNKSDTIIRQFQIGESGTELYDDTEWVTHMRQWGVIVQHDMMIDPSVLGKLRDMVYQAIQMTEEQLLKYRPKIKIGQDDILFQEIGSRGGQRFDLRLYQDEIHSLIRLHILPLVRNRLYGLMGIHNHTTTTTTSHDEEELDFDVSVVYSKPGASYQGWHADGDHLRNHLDAGWTQHGWKTHLADPYAVCMFLALIDLCSETGYTQFWPGSHRSRSLAGFGRVAELAGLTYDGILKAGDAIFYDYRLWHRGMPNNSNRLRPVLQVIFKKSWYVEKANYGTDPIIPV